MAMEMGNRGFHGTASLVKQAFGTGCLGVPIKRRYRSIWAGCIWSIKSTFREAMAFGEDGYRTGKVSSGVSLTWLMKLQLPKNGREQDEAKKGRRSLESALGMTM